MDIPGYYYDNEKGRYFKISDHAISSSENRYSIQTIRRKELQGEVKEPEKSSIDKLATCFLRRHQFQDCINNRFLLVNYCKALLTTQSIEPQLQYEIMCLRNPLLGKDDYLLESLKNKIALQQMFNSKPKITRWTNVPDSIGGLLVIPRRPNTVLFTKSYSSVFMRNETDFLTNPIELEEEQEIDDFRLAILFNPERNESYNVIRDHVNVPLIYIYRESSISMFDPIHMCPYDIDIPSSCTILAGFGGFQNLKLLFIIERNHKYGFAVMDHLFQYESYEDIFSNIRGGWESQPTCFLDYQKYGIFGFKNGDILMYEINQIINDNDEPKLIYQTNIGATVCNMQAASLNGHILVSGLKNTLRLYKIKRLNDSISCEVAIDYKGYHNQYSIERNLQLIGSTKFFLVHSIVRDHIILQLYYLFYDQPLVWGPEGKGLDLGEQDCHPSSMRYYIHGMHSLVVLDTEHQRLLTYKIESY